jgi:hypothetical protein
VRQRLQRGITKQPADHHDPQRNRGLEEFSLGDAEIVSVFFSAATSE